MPDMLSLPAGRLVFIPRELIGGPRDGEVAAVEVAAREHCFPAILGEGADRRVWLGYYRLAAGCSGAVGCALRWEGYE